MKKSITHIPLNTCSPALHLAVKQAVAHFAIGGGKSLGINELEIFNRLTHHFSHLLHAMRHRVGRFFLCTIVMGVFLLVGCEDYSDYPRDVIQSYLAESAKLDSTDTDSIIRFVGKVQRLTQAYPALQQDPSYTQIMQNIPVVSMNITITGATWKDEKTLELGEEKDEKNEKECNLQVANDLIDVSFRHILNFFHPLYLSTEFLNQCVEGCEILACKPSLLSIFESTSDGVGDKSLLRFGSRVARHQLVDGHPFDSKQDLLQAWHEVRILNIQYNLGHEINL